MAQIFRHGDNLWRIKKLILVIFVAHVPFAGTALIYKEKSLICFLCYIYQCLAQWVLLNTDHKHSNNGRKQWKSKKKSPVPNASMSHQL